MPPKTVHGVTPDYCGGCNRDQHKGKGWISIAKRKKDPYRLQCGACGYLVLVTQAVWELRRFREDNYMLDQHKAEARHPTRRF